MFQQRGTSAPSPIHIGRISAFKSVQINSLVINVECVVFAQTITQLITSMCLGFRTRNGLASNRFKPVSIRFGFGSDWEFFKNQFDLISSGTVSTGFIGSNRFQPVWSSFKRFQPVSTTFNQFQTVSNSFNQFQTVSTSFNHFQPVSNGFNRFCSCPVRFLEPRFRFGLGLSPKPEFQIGSEPYMSQSQ